MYQICLVHYECDMSKNVWLRILDNRHKSINSFIKNLLNNKHTEKNKLHTFEW